jgi:predicted GIY-YIG superfamily endonuclease
MIQEQWSCCKPPLSVPHPEVRAKRASKGPAGLIRTVWMYILHCADGSYYTDLTHGEEPEQRLSEHQMKFSPSFTASRLPVRLVYSEIDAIAAVRKIKDCREPRVER